MWGIYSVTAYDCNGLAKTTCFQRYKLNPRKGVVALKILVAGNLTNYVCTMII